MTSWRPPASQPTQDELAVAYARDGYALLEAVYDPSAPSWLREVPAVDVLRRVLVQNCTRTVTAGGREVIKRREKEPEGDGLPPGHARIASPYDLVPGGVSSGTHSGWATSCTSPRPATTTAVRLPRPPGPAGACTTRAARPWCSRT